MLKTRAPLSCKQSGESVPSFKRIRAGRSLQAFIFILGLTRPACSSSLSQTVNFTKTVGDIAHSLPLQPHIYVNTITACVYPTIHPNVKRHLQIVDLISRLRSPFDGLTVEVEGTRKNYGEKRIVCYGLLAGRMVVVGYTPRGTVRHIFSMRKANDREQTRLAPYFGL